MASAIATTIPHQLPPAFVLPPARRIRPPRMLPGTPSPNSNPQPAREAPIDRVWAQGKWRTPPTPFHKAWVQGRWRNRNSKAAKLQQRVQSRMVEKALHHQTHGMNVYAYSHIRTGQVVYSLTRVLENSKVMPQLLFHGKKTVPESLRRDVWMPYFSIHFPQTPAGSQAGLLAYHYLRELSKRRQLSPPADLITTTQEDIDRITGRLDPIEVEEMIRKKTLKLPILNQMLPPKLRAQKLMNQRATSVADVAFVLGLQLVAMPSPNERFTALEERAARKGEGRSKKYQKRQAILDKLKEEFEKKIAERAKLARIVDGNTGQLTLSTEAARRIAVEHQGVVIGRGEVGMLKEVDEANDATLAFEEAQRNNNTKDGATKPDAGAVVIDQSRNVKILWADIRDGTYANEWPKNIVHSELESKAVEVGTRSIIGTSVHVLGAEEGSGFYSEFVENGKRSVEMREEMVRFQVLTSFMDKLTKLSIELDKIINDQRLKVVAGDEDATEPDQFLEAIEKVKLELHALSNEVEDAERKTNRKFPEVEEQLPAVLNRVEPTYRAWDEARLLGEESNTSYIEGYLPLSQFQSKIQIKQLLEEWAPLRQYEEDVHVVNRSIFEKEAAIGRLRKLSKQAQTDGDREKDAETRIEIRQLKILISSERQGLAKLWWNLALSPNIRRMEIQRQKDEQKPKNDEDALPEQKVGWFGRAKSSIMNRLPFIGKRKFSTSARRMTSLPSSKTLEPVELEALCELSALKRALREAARGLEWKSKGGALNSAQAKVLEVGPEKISARVAVLESEFTRVAQVEATLGLHRQTQYKVQGLIAKTNSALQEEGLQEAERIQLQQELENLALRLQENRQEVMRELGGVLTLREVQWKALSLTRLEKRGLLRC